MRFSCPFEKFSDDSVSVQSEVREISDSNRSHKTVFSYFKSDGNGNFIYAR